jgi:hypothetical protein
MLGKALLALTATTQLLGPFLADFNNTHVLNPRWPPHARFHNGQTMSMGLALGLSTLYYTFRPINNDREKAKDSLITAAVFGSLYWVTGLSAVLYPGSKAVDPEFGEGFPQFWLFLGFGVAAWVGAALEIRGLRTGDGKRD